MSISGSTSIIPTTKRWNRSATSVNSCQWNAAKSSVSPTPSVSSRYPSGRFPKPFGSLNSKRATSHTSSTSRKPRVRGTRPCHELPHARSYVLWRTPRVLKMAPGAARQPSCLWFPKRISGLLWIRCPPIERRVFDFQTFVWSQNGVQPVWAHDHRLGLQLQSAYEPHDPRQPCQGTDRLGHLPPTGTTQQSLGRLSRRVHQQIGCWQIT